MERSSAPQEIRQCCAEGDKNSFHTGNATRPLSEKSRKSPRAGFLVGTGSGSPGCDEQHPCLSPSQRPDSFVVQSWDSQTVDCAPSWRRWHQSLLWMDPWVPVCFLQEYSSRYLRFLSASWNFRSAPACTMMPTLVIRLGFKNNVQNPSNTRSRVERFGTRLRDLL